MIHAPWNKFCMMVLGHMLYGSSRKLLGFNSPLDYDQCRVRSPTQNVKKMSENDICAISSVLGHAFLPLFFTAYVASIISRGEVILTQQHLTLEALWGLNYVSCMECWSMFIKNASFKASIYLIILYQTLQEIEETQVQRKFLYSPQLQKRFLKIKMFIVSINCVPQDRWGLAAWKNKGVLVFKIEFFVLWWRVEINQYWHRCCRNGLVWKSTNKIWNKSVARKQDSNWEFLLFG